MGLLQRIANQYAVLISLENGLALQDYATYTIYGGGDEAGVELADVLVSFRTEIVALILVETQVEFGSVLHHCTIKRRQEHMVLVVNLWYRHYQKTMVLTRVTVYKCRRAIGTTSVGTEQFTTKALL